MLRWNMTDKFLAGALGYKPMYLRNVINGACPPKDCAPVRQKIQAYFGREFWKEPLESSARPLTHH